MAQTEIGVRKFLFLWIISFLTTVPFVSCRTCKIYNLETAHIPVPSGGVTEYQQKWNDFDTLFKYNYAAINWGRNHYDHRGNVVILCAPPHIHKKFRKLVKEYWKQPIMPAKCRH